MIAVYIVSPSHLLYLYKYCILYDKGIPPNKRVNDPHLYECLQIITNYGYSNKAQQIKPIGQSILKGASNS